VLGTAARVEDKFIGDGTGHADFARPVAVVRVGVLCLDGHVLGRLGARGCRPLRLKLEDTLLPYGEGAQRGGRRGGGIVAGRWGLGLTAKGDVGEAQE